LELHCVNRSRRNIHIDNIGIKIGKDIITFKEEAVSPKFNSKLLVDRQDFKVTFDMPQLVEGLSKLQKQVTAIQGFVIDGFGKRHDSKKIPFDLDSLLEYYKERSKIGDTFLH